MEKKVNLLKLTSLALCLSALTGSVAACGGTGDAGGASNGGTSGGTGKSTDLIVEVFGGGYGTDWLYKVANEFEKKTGENVEITVQTGSQGISNMNTSFRSYTSPTDIYFTKQNGPFGGIYEGKITIEGKTYDCVYEDLSDVYNSEVEGEGVLYKDKFLKNYEEYWKTDDGKYYHTSWASGIMGIIVNMDVWTDAGMTNFPRTTDELFEMMDTLKGKKVIPFIYSASDEYWTSLSNLWMTQYEGTARMKQIYAGYDADGNRYTNKLADFDGYYEMLKFYEQLLKQGNKYMHTASNDIDFTNMQGMFLQGAAAMCPNGDWLENEMKLNYQNANIALMKSPIISALANKLSFASATDKDAKLRALVDYVDANATGYAGKPDFATEADVDKVRDSRSVELTSGFGHNAFIPCYSNQKELAKDFLRYLATDEAMALYRQSTGGCDLPFYWTNKPDDTGLSIFRQSVNKVMGDSEMWVSSDKDRIYSLGGITSNHFFNNNNGRYVTCFSALSSKDFVSATQYYLAEQEYFKNNIATIKNLAGIN